MVQEKTQEWQIPTWAATLDFKKAFDTVSHLDLWKALKEQGVSQGYITVLRRLYNNQMATVSTDKKSRAFQIQRGTKQGDPLSSLLFNSLLEGVFRKLQPKWARRKCGIRVSFAGAHLTNLRFADDVILFGTSLKPVQRMLREVRDESARVGLELHPDKTKILHNQRHRRSRARPEYVSDPTMQVEILPFGAHQKYLSRKFTFQDQHTCEVDSRIAAGWRKFHALKCELTTRTHSLHGRIRLFHGTVTPTVLYGCTSWALTDELENRLRRAQRQMLRMILGSPRRRREPADDERTRMDGDVDHVDSSLSCSSSAAGYDNTDMPDSDCYNTADHLEPWVEWVERATHKAQQLLERLNIEDWITIQRRRKWRWASQVASDRNKWTYRVLMWEPDLLLDQKEPGRKQARPKKTM